MTTPARSAGSKYVVLMAIEEPMTKDQFVGKLKSFYTSDLQGRKIDIIKQRIDSDFGHQKKFDLAKDTFPVIALQKYRDDYFLIKNKEVVHVVSNLPTEQAAFAAIERELNTATPVAPATSQTQTEQPKVENTIIEQAPGEPAAASSSSASSSSSAASSSVSSSSTTSPFSTYWLKIVKAVVGVVKPFLSENLQTYLAPTDQFKSDEEMINYVIGAKQNQQEEAKTEEKK